MLERLEKAVGQLSQVTSLTLVSSCGRLPSADSDITSTISQDIRRAIQVLDCISRARLGNVQVEFELHRIANLGRSLSWGGPALEACGALEDLLLTFPYCRIILHVLAAGSRMERLEFWSPTIKRAFPKLNEHKLITFTRRTSRPVVELP